MLGDLRFPLGRSLTDRRLSLRPAEREHLLLVPRYMDDRVEVEGSQQFFGLVEVGCHFLFSSLVLISDLENNVLGVTEYFQ